MARPLKEIDGEQVFKLAKLGCTQAEIGEFFGCADTTISGRFREEFQLGKAASRISLRRMQFKKAHAGCTTMLIHLGKQWLGQAEQLNITSDGKPVQPIFQRISDPRNEVVHAPAPTNGVCH